LVHELSTEGWGHATMSIFFGCTSKSGAAQLDGTAEISPQGGPWEQGQKQN
jgi:hypothetical protein